MDIRQKIVGARNFNLVKVSSACRAILLVFLLAAVQCALAQVQPSEADLNPINFDHIKTGFNLTGAHASARCGAAIAMFRVFIAVRRASARDVIWKATAWAR